MATRETDFEHRRRFILGLRAAGLFLVGWGTAAPALLVGLIIVAVVKDRPAEPGWPDMGVIDRVLFALGSKEVLFQWWEVGGMWGCSLVLGWYLLTRDARRAVLVKRFGS
jgi:hypothetical protein